MLYKDHFSAESGTDTAENGAPEDRKKARQNAPKTAYLPPGPPVVGERREPAGRGAALLAGLPRGAPDRDPPDLLRAAPVRTRRLSRGGGIRRAAVRRGSGCGGAAERLRRKSTSCFRDFALAGTLPVDYRQVKVRLKQISTKLKISFEDFMKFR